MDEVLDVGAALLVDRHGVSDGLRVGQLTGVGLLRIPPQVAERLDRISQPEEVERQREGAAVVV
jgi:hypothetical protein